MKRSKSLTWIVLVLAVTASVACAQATPAPSAGGAAAAEAKAPMGTGGGLAIFGCCVGAALAAAGGGLAIAKIGTACLESIARQPEASGQLFTPMIITAAMVEGCILFAIVIGLIGILK